MMKIVLTSENDLTNQNSRLKRTDTPISEKKQTLLTVEYHFTFCWSTSWMSDVSRKYCIHLHQYASPHKLWNIKGV